MLFTKAGVGYTTSAMAASAYEVEIKSLLGNASAAEALKERMKTLHTDCVLRASFVQLNHYFEGGNPNDLAQRLVAYLPFDTAKELARLAREGTKVSVRTRGENGIASIVLKASVGSDTSENGVVRAEAQAPVEGFSLDALDAEALASGYRDQAKWSRARDEYSLGDASMCLDKNAGYGYLAEFEKVVDDVARAESARAELLSLMRELGVSELPQDRLERMFAFYNAHWPEYYGTDKIFVIN